MVGSEQNGGKSGGEGLSSEGKQALRALPAIHLILEQLAAIREGEHIAPSVLANAAREALENARSRILAGDATEHCLARLSDEALAQARRNSRPFHQRVINATGIVLHTNLGRAPLAQVAIDAALNVARYGNLEFDLVSGKRGKRLGGVGPLLAQLLGAQAGTAVNNCAGATVLVLRALCGGREVIVSRGQLVEIGGSFRLPEIFKVAGVKLVEVGATNISRIEDYERAITAETAALLRVHTANYRVMGHTESPGAAPLAKLARAHGLWFIDDVGSGALQTAGKVGFETEPDPRAGLSAGAHITLMSGDKLLGGPQAGLVAGDLDLIHKVEKDPLFRALRLDKMTLAALEATLRLHLDPERAWKEIPALAMLGTPVEDLERRARIWASLIEGSQGLQDVLVVAEKSPVGGGSLPGQDLPTWVVALRALKQSDDQLSASLRVQQPPIISRVQDGRVLLDPRTVQGTEEAEMLDGVKKALAGH